RTDRVVPQSDKRSPRLLRELIPFLHVGNSLFVPLDDDFGAFFDGLPVAAARASTASCSAKREDDFARAVFANGHANRRAPPYDARVFAGHGSVADFNELHQEPENHPTGE